jgi:dipeptidyl-peptidase-4
MTLWAMTRSTPFKAGVAVAPLADYRLYDSIYTERYMSLPKDNESGYERAAATSTAAGLHGALLLVQGTGDDNSHMQNTIQIVQAFINSGKQFDLMLYPRKSHGISGPIARGDLYHRILDHFEKNLKGTQP